MESLLSLLDEKFLYPFLLLLARVVAFVAFMPVFSHTAVPASIRIVLAFYFTVFIYPFINVQNVITQDMFIEALISEITLGLIASFLMNIIFSAIKSLEILLDMQQDYPWLICLIPVRDLMKELSADFYIFLLF